MDYQNFINVPSVGFGVGAVLLIVLGIWELTWKGYGLWRAAQNKETGWFVAILILNTLGILPILYLYVFGKNRDKSL